MRFDVALPSGLDTGAFERAWRAELAAQKMTALAMPPAQAVAARFRVCEPKGLPAGDRSPELERYLAARLAALPGRPDVQREPSAPPSEWTGVRIWLSYRAGELTALLQQTQRKTKQKTKKAMRKGHRP